MNNMYNRNVPFKWMRHACLDQKTQLFPLSDHVLNRQYLKPIDTGHPAIHAEEYIKKPYTFLLIDALAYVCSFPNRQQRCQSAYNQATGVQL